MLFPLPVFVIEGGPLTPFSQNTWFSFPETVMDAVV
jgi:hypothetical protein